MASQYQTQTYGSGARVENPNLESAWSGVSWGAILAGGVAAAGVSLVLLTLGSGLGFASISPWAGDSMSVTGLAVAAGIWLVVVQWLASLVGGYIAGRLRTKWADHHSDEVFFRDTAHGFLAWGVATFLAVGFSIFVGLSAIGGAATGAGVAASAAGSDTNAYALDQLFRDNTAAAGQPAAATTTDQGAQPAAATTTDPAASSGGQPTTVSSGSNPRAGVSDAMRAESGRILQRAVLGTGDDTDRTYLAQKVAQQTGLSEADAQARVDQVVTAAKHAADKARKATAYAAMMTALSLLVGAFIAAAAGALGGRYRDELSTVSA